MAKAQQAKTPPHQNKFMRSVIIGVVVIIAVTILGLTLLNGDDESVVETEDSSEAQLTQPSQQPSSRAQTSSSNSQATDIDSEASSPEVPSASDPIAKVNDQFVDAASPDGRLFPASEQEAAELYCNLLFPASVESESKRDCLAEVDCQTLSIQIAGNFQCQWADYPLRDFSGGIEASELAN